MCLIIQALFSALWVFRCVLIVPQSTPKWPTIPRCFSHITVTLVFAGIFAGCSGGDGSENARVYFTEMAADRIYSARAWGKIGIIVSISQIQKIEQSRREQKGRVKHPAFYHLEPDQILFFAFIVRHNDCFFN